MTQRLVAPRPTRRPEGGRQVSVDERWSGRRLPALIEAHRPGVDLAAWIAGNRARLASLGPAASAVLFRGFAVTGPDDFLSAMKALSDDVLPYVERSSPRSEVVTGIYTSTDHPPDQPIVLHNEQSYTQDWPMLIVFFCQVPPEEGGRTPLADSRRVLARLAPATVEKFERLGVRYVRNYLPGISLSWQEAFQTDSREAVEQYCDSVGIETEWAGAEQLRTCQVRPAIHTHPGTGERVWFNHALFFHVTSLPDEISAGLRAAVAEADLPYNTYYGDGQAIEPETIAELRAAYAEETTAFDWKRGDVLMVENMLAAHGREPYAGERRILTAMADLYSARGRPA